MTTGSRWGARSVVRTVRDHPREAASGAGLGAVVAGLLSSWVVRRVLRSRHAYDAR